MWGDRHGADIPGGRAARREPVKATRAVSRRTLLSANDVVSVGWVADVCKTCLQGGRTDVCNLLEIGPQADALRGRALPRLLEDLSRLPDTPISGPEAAPVDEGTRRRFFGEE